MQYIERHKEACLRVLERINNLAEKTGRGKTTICKAAGAQIHACKVLETGAATVATVQKLMDYLDLAEAALAKAEKQASAPAVDP